MSGVTFIREGHDMPEGRRPIPAALNEVYFIKLLLLIEQALNRYI